MIEAVKKKSKASSVVAALCILVYVAAIAFGAVRIFVNSGERRNLAEKTFSDLADTVSSSAVFLGFMSDAHRAVLEDFITGQDVLLGIILTGSSDEYAFELSPGSGIVWAGDSPRFKAGPGISGEPFYMPLRIDGQRNVTLQAVYGSIDYALYQSVLRNVLIAVLAALLTAFTALGVEMYHKRNAERPAGETIRADEGADVSGAEFAPEPEPLREEREEADLDNLSENDTPRGLYTPRGGIGWETYTRDRLSSELHHCSSFEQDLVFIVMELPEVSPRFRQFADEAIDFFSTRDLLFERGENGISVIIPGVDLEQGITKSEEFRGRISTKLPGSLELCAGLSSRSGRLVDAERLMREASHALEKALEDENSRVVAFKSDPEKYRKFIRDKRA